MHRILPLNVQYLQTLGTYEIETTTYLKKKIKNHAQQSLSQNHLNRKLYT